MYIIRHNFGTITTFLFHGQWWLNLPVVVNASTIIPFYKEQIDKVGPNRLNINQDY